jgi:hypothetical protein
MLRWAEVREGAGDWGVGGAVDKEKEKDKEKKDRNC